jgi:CRISPR-associated protein Csx16
MTTYFVSRHSGAREWAEMQGIVAEQVEHFDVAIVQDGDVVIGTLPINLVAEVNKRGGRYLHLTMAVPQSRRGDDLTADEMKTFGACLQEYSSRRVE